MSGKPAKAAAPAAAAPAAKKKEEPKAAPAKAAAAAPAKAAAAPAKKVAAPAAKKVAAPAAAKAKAAPVATPKFAPIVAAFRPSVSIRSTDKDAVTGKQTLPAVFVSPIRPDIVHFVHSNMNKNSRQAYAVSPGAGHQHSAESWGTGRAVSRVPRVSGGGTGRAGQGAFANSCRKGRMFAPTKTWRKWHRKINVNQKRFAVASALAASALPSLVFARGHRIANVPEIPLVADNAVESVTKTKQAVAALKSLGAYDDVTKAADSKKLRAGKGKMRNRRYVSRRGPLVVYKNDNGISRAFRNLPGVELAQVDSLSLLQLAPGGHLGRFVLWTANAFARLVDNWGTLRAPATTKSGYRLPRPQMANSDLTRIINSDEIQSKLRPAQSQARTYRRKKNPLTNFGVKVKLNPYALALRRAELLTQEKQKTARAALIDAKRKAADKPAAAKPAAAAGAKKVGYTNAQKTKNFNYLTNDLQFPLSATNNAHTEEAGFNAPNPAALKAKLEETRASAVVARKERIAVAEKAKAEAKKAGGDKKAAPAKKN